MAKYEKGITLITLIITIIVMLILVSTISIKMTKSSGYSSYKKMCADITILQDRALIYYKKYGEAPKKGTGIENVPAGIVPTGTFYEIDLEDLPNLTLHYGTSDEANDKYIINNTSLKVYYLKGIEYKDELVYTIKDSTTTP